MIYVHSVCPVFDQVVFALQVLVYYCPGLPTWFEKTCSDLLLISYDNILKKKHINVQVKLSSFYFTEKDRKPRA